MICTCTLVGNFGPFCDGWLALLTRCNYNALLSCPVQVPVQVAVLESAQGHVKDLEEVPSRGRPEVCRGHGFFLALFETFVVFHDERLLEELQ